MRSMIVPVLAVALTATSAFAADSAPLPAGKPAGVHQAQMGGNSLFFLLGAAVIAGGIAIAVSNNGNNVSTSTTGTAP